MLRREQSKFGDLRFVFLYRRFRFCACKKRSGFPLPIARSLMIPTAFSPDILPDGSHSSVPEIVTDKNYHVHTESFPKPQMDSSPCFLPKKRKTMSSSVSYIRLIEVPKYLGQPLDFRLLSSRFGASASRKKHVRFRLFNTHLSDGFIGIIAPNDKFSNPFLKYFPSTYFVDS
jgi:hypothetical protein